MVKAGGGLLVDDAELTPEWVQSNVLPVLADPHRLYEMSRAAAEFGRRDADELLVGMVYEAIAGHAARRVTRRQGAWPDRPTAERGERQQDVGVRPAPAAGPAGPAAAPRLRPAAASCWSRRPASLLGGGRGLGCCTARTGCACERVSVTGHRGADAGTGARRRRVPVGTPLISVDTDAIEAPTARRNCPGSTRLTSSGPGRTESV